MKKGYRIKEFIFTIIILLISLFIYYYISKSHFLIKIGNSYKIPIYAMSLLISNAFIAIVINRNPFIISAIFCWVTYLELPIMLIRMEYDIVANKISLLANLFIINHIYYVIIVPYFAYIIYRLKLRLLEKTRFSVNVKKVYLKDMSKINIVYIVMMILFVTLSIIDLYYLDGLKGWFGSIGVEESTIYAKGYSDNSFRKIKVGMSDKDVLLLLGDPLSKELIYRDGDVIIADNRAIAVCCPYGSISNKVKIGFREEDVKRIIGQPDNEIWKFSKRGNKNIFRERIIRIQNRIVIEKISRFINLKELK